MSQAEGIQCQFLFRSREALDHLGQVLRFFKNRRGLNLALTSLRANVCADGIPQQDRFKRKRRLEVHVILDGEIQNLDHLADHIILVFHVADSLVNLGGGSDLCL